MNHHQSDILALTDLLKVPNENSDSEDENVNFN